MKRFVFLSLALALTLTTVSLPATMAKGPSALQPNAVAAAPAELQFTLVNKTGYDIKGLYLAPHSSEEWDKSDELLKGQSFSNGSAVNIVYKSGEDAPTWDLMVVWTDGSPNSKWDDINLNGTRKATLTYDRGSDTTTITKNE